MSMSGQTACIACNISRYVHTIYMFELLCIMLFACLYYGFCAPHRIARACHEFSAEFSATLTQAKNALCPLLPMLMLISMVIVHVA